MKIDKRRLKKGLRMALTFVPTVGPALEILVEDIRASQTELDQQVTQAIESLQQTSALISRLEQALGERTEKVNRLREEYERYSKLSEIGADKAEALIRQLSLTVGQNQKRER